ncbi:MAG: hypothetical protein LPK85_10430 [Gammaproteobacteria bacterium]|nr:hypothetical protein [Gammaproteobacteria bacterium]
MSEQSFIQWQTELSRLQALMRAELGKEEPDFEVLQAQDGQVRTLMDAAVAAVAPGEWAAADAKATLVEVRNRLAELMVLADKAREQAAERLKQAGRTGRAARAYQSNR